MGVEMAMAGVEIALAGLTEPRKRGGGLAGRESYNSSDSLPVPDPKALPLLLACVA